MKVKFKFNPDTQGYFKSIGRKKVVLAGVDEDGNYSLKKIHTNSSDQGQARSLGSPLEDYFFEKLIQLEFVCQQSIQEDLRFYNQVAERHEEVKPNFDAKKVVSAVTTDFQRKFAAMASFTDITHNDSIDRFSKSDLHFSVAKLTNSDLFCLSFSEKAFSKSLVNSLEILDFKSV